MPVVSERGKNKSGTINNWVAKAFLGSRARGLCSLKVVSPPREERVLTPGLNQTAPEAKGDQGSDHSQILESFRKCDFTNSTVRENLVDTVTTLIFSSQIQ